MYYQNEMEEILEKVGDAKYEVLLSPGLTEGIGHIGLPLNDTCH
jgi:hypothetical protein